MVINAVLRRRPLLSEHVPDLLHALCRRLEAIEGFWSHARHGSTPVLNGGNDVAPTAVLNRFLVPGIHGQLFFTGRFPNYVERDEAEKDDVLSLSIDTDQIEFAWLCRTVFPLLVDAFSAYRGFAETEEEVSQADFERVRKLSATRPESDRRNGVIRLWPVCFIDDLLCRRSFDLSAEAVVPALSPHCERAELRNGGALIIATTDVLTGAALDEVDARLRHALGKLA